MRKRPLMVAALAVLVLSGGLVACDEPRVDALHASCTTKDLRWKVTVLKKKARSTHREGRLSAVNTGARECVFRGFPDFLVRVGKGPEAGGVGHGRARAVSLPAGSGVVVDLRYRDAERGHPAPADCLVGNGSAEVTAPRDTQGTLVRAWDESGRRARLDVCDNVIRMEPPRKA
ncbi:hypothetical protein A6A06_06270 [Streptomyces sp. CB02923]|uniref:DUF4232 domain-containing protein n=1 Tax=Streptomyces sp. CB02923 TaxID=1718985 RepID=UPI000962966B|nr:DUF4232 domain-containing protein [Streptomyces sp. CB02923]OKI04414.1 hypothetical protein A6A06_06270 [Streptomyces sp. CB02923]